MIHHECYDTDGVEINGRNHPTICDYVECDEESKCFVCTAHEPPAPLLVNIRKSNGVIVEKFIDYPPEGCPNGGPKTYAIGHGYVK